MNCQKFESIVSDLARNQIMEVDARKEALSHSSECDGCSARLRDEEMLTRGFRALVSEMSSLDAPSSVETRLRDAFREPRVVVPLRVSRNYRRYWLTAVAAMLLIVVGVLAMRWSRTEPPAPQNAGVQPQEKKNNLDENTAVHNSTPEPQPLTVAHKPKPKRRNTINPAVLQARAVRPTSDNQSHHAEVATEFMPLGYLNARALQDGGQIVRIEVPRTTLASFGLPVNMERYNEKVKADILLGLDGRARAIRFVQDKREE